MAYEVKEIQADNRMALSFKAGTTLKALIKLEGGVPKTTFIRYLENPDQAANDPAGNVDQQGNGFMYGTRTLLADYNPSAEPGATLRFVEDELFNNYIQVDDQF